MLTAYDFLIAKILDVSPVDIILVGDSVGTTQLGLPNTLNVSMEQMLHHIAAVSKGVKRALIVGDMPFGSYQVSISDGIENAIKMIKAGANAVKIEGAKHLELIEKLVSSGIPVMGHIGLTPQFVNFFGGHKIQGKGKHSQELLKNDAILLEKAGVFSIVIEGVPPSTSKIITDSVTIPTIGIGAGPHCDGQVLVITDLLGLDPEFNPVYLKKYANLFESITVAVTSFCKEVHSGTFPSSEHSYHEESP